MPTTLTVCDVAIPTSMSVATLFGAKVSVTFASGPVTVPPAVALTSAGGDRPLAVFAVGSGGEGSALGGAAAFSGTGAAAVAVPTTTVAVPVPLPATVIAGVAAAAGSCGAEVVTGCDGAVLASSTGAVTSVCALLPALSTG